MDRFDPEQLTEESNARLNESAQRDPRACPWGLFAWGDAPPACGGGVGAFQWFATLEELMEFITDWSAAGYLTFDDEEDWHQQQPRLRSLAKHWHENPAATLLELNQELKGLLQIDWIGTYQDLKSADDAFGRRIQEAFAEEQAVPESKAVDMTDTAAQHNSETEEAFVAFLATYGL